MSISPKKVGFEGLKTAPDPTPILGYSTRPVVTTAPLGNRTLIGST